ncbi:MAG: FprA family A-type flavoprotein, partial [Muribaculaceae bacterium]|nr:FprA family A-type flavoprotein [Muribaculaceae bacterium]
TYIGVDDPTLDLFENQYHLSEGVSYNSYLVKGEKTAVIDTTDDRTGEEWLGNLKKALNGGKPDYLVIEHMEPDHSSLIETFTEIYPEATIVISATGARMLPNYLDPVPDNTKIMAVKEGDVLDLGGITLQFYLAPMVHWPEVMMAYCPERKLLFSADAFGTFGTLDSDREDWATEARRYYYNIVGKYGPQVQTALKKLANLDIRTICPLHGPILTEDISKYVEYYQKWSTYTPEAEGILIACASIHGNTMEAALYLAELLRNAGIKDVAVADLTRSVMSKDLAEAFKYPKAVFCASSYDAGLFTPMYSFLHLLEIKGYRERKVALMQNGSWAPSAAKVMKTMLEGMKDIDIMPDIFTINGIFKESDRKRIANFAKALIEF